MPRPEFEFDRMHAERQAYLRANYDTVEALTSFVGHLLVSSLDFDYDWSRKQVVFSNPGFELGENAESVERDIMADLWLLQAADRRSLSRPAHPARYRCRYFLNSVTAGEASSFQTRPNLEVIGCTIINYGVERKLKVAMSGGRPRDFIWKRTAKPGLLQAVVKSADPQHRQTLIDFLKGDTGELEPTIVLSRISEQGYPEIADWKDALLLAHRNVTALRSELGNSTFESVPPVLALEGLRAELGHGFKTE